MIRCLLQVKPQVHAHAAHPFSTPSLEKMLQRDIHTSRPLSSFILKFFSYCIAGGNFGVGKILHFAACFNSVKISLREVLVHSDVVLVKFSFANKL